MNTVAYKFAFHKTKGERKRKLHNVDFPDKYFFIFKVLNISEINKRQIKFTKLRTNKMKINK